MATYPIPTNLSTNTPFIAHWGTNCYKTQTWVKVMDESFKAVDQERNALTSRGSWTARTNNIQRYARIDFYG